MTASAFQFVLQTMSRAIPQRWPGSTCDWARKHVKLPGSTLCKEFDLDLTPWIKDVINDLDRLTVRRSTIVAPVQSGKSVAGEVVICKLISTSTGGDLQYNWQNDLNADERFSKRVERILLACEPVMARAPAMDKQSGRWCKGLILFPHMNFIMQGIHTQRRVASDSITYQINEEIHDTQGWLPGRLKQAFARTTTVWNHKIFNISNAGAAGCELDIEFNAGTVRRWEVLCPGCHGYHVMRVMWEDSRPDLGGLRYDADGCRRDDGTYDYNRLAGTIRYQMPCGYIVHENKLERRQLSMGGRYSDPTNTGADGTIESRTLEAVAIDYIPFISLIMQKHDALRAKTGGDIEPWKAYLRERECVFASDDLLYLTQKIQLVLGKRKEHSGLPGRAGRFAALDRQQGQASNDEPPHWWLVIRDVMENADSLLVYEGKVMSDAAVLQILKDHGVEGSQVVCDSSDDTRHVYEFAYANGFHCLKARGDALFRHPDNSRRIFSPPIHLFKMMGCDSKTGFDIYPPQSEEWKRLENDEPVYWEYSEQGIQDRLHFLRGSTSWGVPEDVSDVYKKHIESSYWDEKRKKWAHRGARFDLHVCECYIAMLIEMAGLIGWTKQTEATRDDDS